MSKSGPNNLESEQFDSNETLATFVTVVKNKGKAIVSEL